MVNKMATENPRINAIFEALELQGHIPLSVLAMSLDKEEIKTYSHDDAWR